MQKLLILLCLPLSLWAQSGESEFLSLQEVVRLAREKSVASLLAETRRETSYWEYRTYRSGLFPQLSLSSTLPDFAKTYSPVTQPDGSVAFQPIVNNNSLLNLEMSQNIGLTGGEVFVSSQLQRFDDFERNTTRYNSNPVFVGYRQSIFGFNPFRWDRQIEPLRLEASRRQYLTDLESVSLKGTQFYFDLLLAQTNYNMASQNVEHGRKTLEIAVVRHKMGKLSQNDLLQVQYNLLIAQNALAQARQDVQTAWLQLKSFVGLPQAKITAVEPIEVPQFFIDQELAISEARKNKEVWLNFQIRELKAKRDLNKAEVSNGLNAELFATVGLVNRAGQVEQAYQDPVNQQSIRLGISIPLLDWGKNKARIKTAEANQQLVEYTVRQDQINFEQQIVTQVEQLNSLQSQLEVAEEAAAVARQRYRIADESFALGKISITELNIAQTEKDQARRIYLQFLQAFWESYYNLRLLTLYDFEQQEPIVNLESRARNQEPRQ